MNSHTEKIINIFKSYGMEWKCRKDAVDYHPERQFDLLSYPGCAKCRDYWLVSDCNCIHIEVEHWIYNNNNISNSVWFLEYRKGISRYVLCDDSEDIRDEELMKRLLYQVLNLG